jgi:hypothetical protein
MTAVDRIFVKERHIMKSVWNDVSETLAVWSEGKWNAFGRGGTG